MEYFIIDNNGQQTGPFSPDQLIQKNITPETLVWAQGMKDWTPAWKIEELKNVLEAIEANRTHAEQQPTATVPPAYTAPQPTPQQNAGTGQQACTGEQPEHPKKKTNKTLWKIIAGLIIALLLIFAITNPSKETHEEAVRTEVSKAIDQATESTDNNFFTQGIRMVAKMMAGNMVETALDQLFEYHNYILFSKGAVTLNGESHTISYGFLGKVFTLNADDMVKALEKEGNLNIEESESTSDDNANIDSSTNDGDATTGNVDNDDSNGQGQVQQQLEDKANKAIDRVADKVSKKVEDKINQKLNEVTDSSTIEKLIDKIFSLF